jgi:plastocyanin
VLRFTLQVGVHNVNFLPDSNPGRQNLPKVSDMLQLPGQTHDIKLDFGTGRFYFQCDPHALLGMIGHVKVEEKDDDKK